MVLFSLLYLSYYITLHITILFLQWFIYVRKVHFHVYLRSFLTRAISLFLLFKLSILSLMSCQPKLEVLHWLGCQTNSF